MTSSQAEEIELLERVLLRLGCADSDEQLQNTVNKFLTPVLIKITSPHENVRRKVMEILTHVNKRLKSRPQVKIPLGPLLTHYQQSSSSFLINFAIIYITMGFPRMTIEEQTEMAPALMNCLEGKPEPHQDKILMLVLPLLGAIKIPENPENRSELLGLSNKPHTKNQLLSILMDILLLPYGVTQDGEIPAGMSSYSFKRVTVDNLKAEELEQLKKGIVRFLNGGIFPELEIISHLIVASADTRFSVATPALAELNKICSSLDWTDAKLSAPLYGLFSGNGSKIPDRKTTGCSTRVRQKLLQHLLKCRGNGIITAKGIQIIFEALFGEVTNQKCKVLALQFAYNLINHGQPDLINKLSKVLLTGITKLIGVESPESYEVQIAAYNAMSQLAVVCPASVNQDVNLIVAYFEHLAQAPSELHSSIREALVSIAQSFDWKKQPQFNKEMDQSMTNMDNIMTANGKFIPNSNQILLLGLLGEKAESKLTYVQNVASVYLTTCFPDFYVPSRYLLLIICGESSQLKEMMTTYLYGVSKKDHINYSAITSINNIDNLEDNNPENRRIVLPNFRDMINYVTKKAESKAVTTIERANYGKVTLPYNFDTYTEILDYLRICLWFDAGIESHPGDEKGTGKLREFIAKMKLNGNEAEIEKYCELVRKLVIARKGLAELLCIYDVLNAMPQGVAKNNMDLMPILKASLKEVTEATRSMIAKIYGILMAYCYKDDEFDAEIKELLALTNKSLEHRHGSILAVSNAIHRRILIAKMDDGLEKIKESDGFKNTVQLMISLLNHQQALLQSASIKSLSLIGSVSELPLPEEEEAKKEEKKEDEKMEVDDESTSVKETKSSLYKTVMVLLQSSHTKPKIREDAAHCLGYLCVGDALYFTKKVLKGFLGLLRMSKDPALHIAIGQAIVYATHGLSVEEAEEAKSHDDETLNWFIIELVKNINEPHAYSKQACAIWLLAIVKNCCKRNPVVNNRQILQLAFTDLLSEDNELVQDVASRGLGIIFSISNLDSQAELSNLLLDQLTGGRRQVQKVAEDTKLFEEGVLGKAPSGGNLTTYKELCSLASDLNQPDMIYQFMQLANHNAAWNSKLGAAFGLQSISKSAKIKMEPYLGKIVPRLFRYKYDPTPKIQNSMCSIWDSVVTDSKSTIELYYWEILEDVTENMTSNEWRVRIACCLAVRDLIKRPAGLKLRSDNKAKKEEDEMETDSNSIPEPELAKLWSQLFRVMDDVHEGTRLAAEGTANALSKVCVVASSDNHCKSGINVSSSIIPLFLETGVTHMVPEIRKLSIKTLSDLIESAGSLILPHLSSLVPCLLQATGELDSAKLSYLSTASGAHSGLQDEIDSLRADAAKQHYTMETLSKCIRYIDYPTFEKMTPAVLEVLRTGVNLGTKVACAHFICLISVHLGDQMQPIVSKYLGSCFTGLSDRNSTVRKYFGAAIGHLIGCAKEQSVIRLLAKLQELYFEQQTMNKSKAVPQTIQAINKRHQEILKDYANNVLPLMFFAMHEEVNEENKQTVEMWQDLWNEINTGDAGLRMNLDSIIQILESTLNNPSWLLKAQAGNALNTLATKLSSNLDDSVRTKLIELLLNNVSGRTFQGKEKLLQALASLCKNLKKDGIHLRIVDAVMKECRKEEPVYRTQALKALGNILDELKEDRFEEVYNMVWHLLDKKDLSDDKETGTVAIDERNKQMMIFVNLKETVCETLGKAWPENSIETQKKYQVMFVEKCVQCLKLNTRQVQICLLQALGRFLERLNLLNKRDESMEMDEVNREKKVKVDDDSEEILEKICKHVLSSIVDVSGIPHTGLKKEALNIMLILINKLKAKDSPNELNLVKSTFNEISQTLQKDSAPEIKCRLKDIEDKLK